MTDTKRSSSVVAKGRAHERVKLNRRAKLVVEPDTAQTPLEVTLEDISFGGAGLVSLVALYPDTPAILLLESHGTELRSIRGHIVDSKPIANDQFRISMQFDAVRGRTIERIRYAFFPDDVLSN